MLSIAECRALAEQRLTQIAVHSEPDLVMLEQVVAQGNTAPSSIKRRNT